MCLLQKLDLFSSIGGFAALKKGWKWPLYELFWISTSSFIVLFLFLPETSEGTILLRRAKRLRALTRNEHLFSQSEIDQEHLSKQEALYDALLRPFILLLDPVVAFLDLYMALVYSVFYLWFEAFPATFEDLHHFNLGEDGLAFLGLAVGIFITMTCYIAWIYFVEEPRAKRREIVKPE